MAYIGNIEEQTKQNKNFRKVLFTGKYSQLVVMALKPGEEIGNEVHNDVDQFIRFEEGEGRIVLNNVDEHTMGDGDAVLVPAGTWHNVINASNKETLKLYTVYSPPEHPDGTVHKTKTEADASHH